MNGVLLLLVLPQAEAAVLPEPEPTPAPATWRVERSFPVDDDDREMRLAARVALRGLGDWTFQTSLGGLLSGDSDLDVGNLSVSRIGARFDAWRPIGRRQSLGIHWEFEESGFAFSDETQIDALEDVYLTRLHVNYRRRTSDDLEWTYHVGLELGIEEGSDASEGLVVRGGLLSTYTINRYLDVTAGGYAWTRLEDDPIVLPYAEVDWRPTDRLHVGWEGSGLGVGYEWQRDVRTYASVGFRERQYRLDEFDIGPQLVDDGVGRDDELALQAGIVLPWYPRLKLELFGGAFLRQATLLDDRGNEAFQDTTDPTYFFGLALLYGEF